MKFTLSEQDATRLECPREVQFDLDKLMGRELIVLQKSVGWNFELLQRKLAGEPLTDTLGNQLFELDDDGSEKRDEAGNRVRAIGLDFETILVMIWLACRRAKGADIAWETFDVNLMAAVVDDPGKDPTPTSSTTRKTTKAATRTTKPRSRTSSTSRRGTSTTG